MWSCSWDGQQMDRIRCVHETSGSINNVTVGTRNAGWPYYRRLID